jgi:hypothetical protein
MPRDPLRPRTVPRSRMWSLVLAAVVVGAVQAGVLGGLLRTTRQVTGTGDRGFGHNPSIAVEAGWLLAFLVVSAILVPSAVALLRVRHPVALAVPVLVVELVLAAVVGAALPGPDVWRALVLAPVLALELLVVSLLYGRRPASASEPT